jgi:hypothetical protein
MVVELEKEQQYLSDERQYISGPRNRNANDAHCRPHKVWIEETTTTHGTTDLAYDFVQSAILKMCFERDARPKAASLVFWSTEIKSGPKY